METEEQRVQRPGGEEGTAGPKGPERRSGGHCKRSQAGTRGSFRGVPGLDGGGKRAVIGEASGQWPGWGWAHALTSHEHGDSHKERSRNVGEPSPFSC